MPPLMQEDIRRYYEETWKSSDVEERAVQSPEKALEILQAWQYANGNTPEGRGGV